VTHLSPTAPAPLFPPPGSRAVEASYESVTYQSRAIRSTDPDTIAAIATLHGMTPAPPDRCRVLELGCGTGANLIGAAYRFPKSTFVGIDLAPTHIESGLHVVSEAGLRNVALQARSIADITDADGTFDYIICHGVYSWVPADIQDATLRVCSRNLAPNGVAYVSYNTYPGWHRRGMLRDMMLFHDDPSLEPERRIARARALAETLASAHAKDTTIHGASLIQEAAALRDQNDRHLFHEQLEPWNEPLYFSEFMRRAEAHRLAYLGEANSSEPDGAVEMPASLVVPGDRIRTEQYRDFVRGRIFRRTLLRHAETNTSDEPTADAVRRLRARARVTRAEPSAEDAARGPGVAAFQRQGGAVVTTNNPLIVQMLSILVDAAPVPVAFDDLVRQVGERLGAAPDADDLAGALLMCGQLGFVEFCVHAPKLVAAAGALPKASGLARWQALYSEEVTTLTGGPYRLMGAERFLIEHLDGAKDRAQLARLVGHAFTNGTLALPNYVPSPESLLDIVDQLLERLARAGLLIA
jgi:SAM-dependent methyltransferase/methyltransferase-like protein